MFGAGMLGIFAPWMMFIGFSLSMIANGIVITLYIAKTQRLGALALTGLIVGILMTLTGHAWFTLLFCVVFGFFGDLIAKSGNFTHPIKNALAYATFHLWMIGPWIPLFYAADSYFQRMETQMGAEYAAQTRALFTPTVLIIFFIFSFLLNFGAGLFGNKILTKHFKRAGVV